MNDILSSLSDSLFVVGVLLIDDCSVTFGSATNSSLVWLDVSTALPASLLGR